MTYEFTPMGTAGDWKTTARDLAKQAGQWHRVEGDGIPEGGLHIRLGRSPDGRLACTGLTLGIDAGSMQEITARDLRSVKLGEILSTIADYVAGKGGSDPLSNAILGHYAKQMLRDTAPDMPARPRRPGPAGWSDEHYELVAETYRRGLVEAPRAPVKYVMDQMTTSEGSARRWIKTARDRGLLGAATPGKAGETPTKAAKLWATR